MTVQRYTITTHKGLPGVRLSKAGHWVNEPFPNEHAAREYARFDAAGPDGFTIELETAKRRKK